MQAFLDDIGGRKFTYALLVITLAFFLTIFKVIEGKLFLDFATLIGGVYVIGNVASKFADRKK